MNLAPSSDPSFASARPLAQHCAELLRTGPRPEERAENIALWCRDLGYDLSEELGQLFSGGKLTVRVAEPEEMAGSEVFNKVGPVAANSLLRCGDDGEMMLLSLDFATAIALTDSSFGGDGTIPSEAPSQLPRSAGLLVEECAGTIAQVIAMSNGSSERNSGDVLVRSESIKRLKPFAPDAKVMLFAVTLTMETGGEWSLMLVAESDQLDALLPGTEASRNRSRSVTKVSDGQSGSFAQIPLSLEAVLGELTMTLSQLETLKPGDELPLAMPRDLPLRLSEQTFAHGMLGTMENQLALKLTRLSGKDQTGAVLGNFTRAFTSSAQSQPAQHAAPAPAPAEAMQRPPESAQRIEGMTA